MKPAAAAMPNAVMGFLETYSAISSLSSWVRSVARWLVWRSRSSASALRLLILSMAS